MNLIRYYRMQKKMSMKELAMDAGISIGYLSHLEKGEREPSRKVMANIASVLEKEVPDIFYASILFDQINKEEEDI